MAEALIASSDSQPLTALFPSRKLDARGLVCPFPAFETAKLVSQSRENEILEIITDDKYVALNSIPTVLKIRNYEYSVKESGDGSWSVMARRKSDPK